MKFRSLLTAAALAALPTLAQAESKVRKITLDECIQEAFANNLEIKIVKYMPELAELSLSSTYGSYDPQYSFNYGANKNTFPAQSRLGEPLSPPRESWSENFGMGLSGLLPTGANYRFFGDMNPLRTKYYDPISQQYAYQDPTYSGRAGVELSQPLLQDMWIDQARWAISLSKKSILQEEQAVRSQLIQTATDIQVAYYRVAASRENIQVQKKAVELAERLLEENKKRVEVGAMAPLESQQAEAQLASTRTDLINAQKDYGLAQNTLRRLLTSDYSDIANTTFDPTDKFVPQPYPFNRMESWSRGLSSRPDIVRSQLALEKQNVTIRFRRNQMFPQMDLVSSFSASALANELGTSLNDISNTDYKSYGVGARFTFPLGNRTASSNFKSAKVERERLILQHKQLEQSIMAAIDNAILVAQSALEGIQSTKQARIYAEQALDAEQKKLENGKSTTFEVLRLQRDLTTASSNEVRALLDYHAAMAVLFQDEGSTLDRLGIKVTSN